MIYMAYYWYIVVYIVYLPICMFIDNDVYYDCKCFFYTQLYYLIVYQYIHNLYITSKLFFEYILHINDT